MLPLIRDLRRGHSDLDLENWKKMIVIDSATFMMGALDNDEEAWEEEKPRHKVTLTNRYAIGKYQVTQAFWQSLMGDNPSSFNGSGLPVEGVNWFECLIFCNKLSELSGMEKVYTLPEEIAQHEDKYRPDLLRNLSGFEVDELAKAVYQNINANGFRLPTEAEWEYAARGPSSHMYSGSNVLKDVAWYKENSNLRTHKVGRKKQNAFGIHDMTGNVDEWCWDRTDFGGEDVIRERPKQLYDSSPHPRVDPLGAPTGTDRAIRGGGWNSSPQFARVSYRCCGKPSLTHQYLGFRIARTMSFQNEWKMRFSKERSKVLLWEKPFRPAVPVKINEENVVGYLKDLTPYLKRAEILPFAVVNKILLVCLRIVLEICEKYCNVVNAFLKNIACAGCSLVFLVLLLAGNSDQMPMIVVVSGIYIVHLLFIHFVIPNLKNAIYQ
jgi:formylglycine-generating enzyme